MKGLLRNGLIPVSCIISVDILISPKAFSSPLFDEGSWRAHSFYTRTSWAGLSSGIGGLQSDIEEAKNLRLEPSAISYNGGELRANIENKQVSVKASPNIVQEAIKVVEQTDKLVFQTSVDITAVGQNEYIDEALQKEGIGNLFLKGDLGFAQIVQIGQPYPRMLGEAPQPNLRERDCTFSI